MVVHKKIKITGGELCYIIFFVLMFAAKGIGLYDGQPLYKLILLVSLVCIGVKMCITKHSLKEWLFIIAVVTLTAVVYLVSKEKGIVLCVLMVIGMKDVSLERIFKLGLWTWSLSMLVLLPFYLINPQLSVFKVHEKLGLGPVFRWSLGYSHPNILHISYLILVALMVYYLGERFKIKHALIMMVGNLFIFLYTLSYTGIMITTAYIGLSWYRSWRKKFNLIEYGLTVLVFPLCLLLSFLSVFILPRNLFWIMNTVFSNRLILAEYYLVPGNIKLFGNNLEQITNAVLTMDNAYIFAFIIYGVIFFVIIVISYICLIYTCIRQKKDRQLIMIICFLIAGITEPFLFNTSFKNLTLLFMGTCLFTWLERRSRGEKTWGFFPKLNREVLWNLENLMALWKKAKTVWKCYSKGLLIGAIWGSICITAIYGLKKEMPKGYVVPRVHTDVVEDDTWYLESEDDPAYEGMEVVGYVDSVTRMQIYTGNIVALEFVRGCVSTFILATAGITAAGIIVLWRKEGLKRK